jgi:hypothetical protein
MGLNCSGRYLGRVRGGAEVAALRPANVPASCLKNCDRGKKSSFSTKSKSRHSIPPKHLALALLCWPLKIRIYRLSDKSFYLDNGGRCLVRASTCWAAGANLDHEAQQPPIFLWYGLDKIAVSMRFLKNDGRFTSQPAARGGRSARLDILSRRAECFC